MPFSGFVEQTGTFTLQKVRMLQEGLGLTARDSPLISYDSVTEDEDKLAKIKNLTMFYEDLSNNALPQWLFITPNMTNDGHDSSVTVAGTWAKSFLEPLLTNDNFMNNTLVFLSQSLFPVSPNTKLTIFQLSMRPKVTFRTTECFRFFLGMLSPRSYMGPRMIHHIIITA